MVGGTLEIWQISTRRKTRLVFLATPKQTPKSANQLPAPTLKITIKVSCYLPLFSWKEGVRVMTPVHGYRGSEKQGCKYPQRRFFINQPEKLLLGWNTFLQEFCRGYWNQSTLEPVFSWNTFPLRGSVEVIETWLLTPFWEIIPPTKELRLTVGCGGWDFRNFTNFDPQKNKTGFLAIPKQTPKSANQLPAPTLKITMFKFNERCHNNCIFLFFYCRQV